MRLVAGVLTLALFVSPPVSPLARAQDTVTPEASRAHRSTERPTGDVARHKLPLRLVRVLPDSRQALLFDRVRATHVLAEVGGKLDGYTVEDIDDDTVTLSRDDQQIVLVAPARSSRRHRDPDAVPVRSVDATPSGAGEPITREPAPIDPYGDAAGAASGGERSVALRPAETTVAGIHVARAPTEPTSRAIAPGEGGIRVAEAPGAAAPAAPVPTPAAELPAAPVATAGGAAPAAPVPAGDTQITRPAATAASAAQAGTAAGGANPPEARTASTSEPRAVAAPGAPDTQPLDAGALADAFTTAPAPSPQGPTTGAPTDARPRTAAPTSLEGARSAGAIVVSRGELDGALADFAGLTAAVRGSFSASGATIEAVGEGTIFERAGLRAGDVVTEVDGIRLRTLDDAADLYARASTARAITAQILRGGKPVALHVVIR